MKLRCLPPPSLYAREELKPVPDLICVRSYRSNVGDRFLVEARTAGRVLGDKDFASHADALAFARMERDWTGAKLIDQCGTDG